MYCNAIHDGTQLYFSIPLEQGLRLSAYNTYCNEERYFSIPLEQGLRLKAREEVDTQMCILVFH